MSTRDLRPADGRSAEQQVDPVEHALESARKFVSAVAGVAGDEPSMVQQASATRLLLDMLIESHEADGSPITTARGRRIVRRVIGLALDADVALTERDLAWALEHGDEAILRPRGGRPGFSPMAIRVVVLAEGDRSFLSLLRMPGEDTVIRSPRDSFDLELPS